MCWWGGLQEWTWTHTHTQHRLRMDEAAFRHLQVGIGVRREGTISCGTMLAVWPRRTKWRPLSRRAMQATEPPWTRQTAGGLHCRPMDVFRQLCTSLLVCFMVRLLQAEKAAVEVGRLRTLQAERDTLAADVTTLKLLVSLCQLALGRY